jgi:hypothetical protein
MEFGPVYTLGDRAKPAVECGCERRGKNDKIRDRAGVWNNQDK